MPFSLKSLTEVPALRIPRDTGDVEAVRLLFVAEKFGQLNGISIKCEGPFVIFASFFHTIESFTVLSSLHQPMDTVHFHRAWKKPVGISCKVKIFERESICAFILPQQGHGLACIGMVLSKP